MKCNDQIMKITCARLWKRIEIYRKILARNLGNMLFLTFLTLHVQATAQNNRDLTSYILPLPLPLCIRNTLQQQGLWAIGKRRTRPRWNLPEEKYI